MSQEKEELDPFRDLVAKANQANTAEGPPTPTSPKQRTPPPGFGFGETPESPPPDQPDASTKDRIYRAAQSVDDFASSPAYQSARVLGVALVIAIFCALLVTSWFTTGADDLEVGDCFKSPPGQSFNNVDRQDCATDHDAEVFATLAGLAVTSVQDLLQENPSDVFNKDQTNFETCVEIFGNLPGLTSKEVPSDAIVRSIPGAAVADDTLCVIWSPSRGLVGSVVS